jgi:hypothetical protein
MTTMPANLDTNFTTEELYRLNDILTAFADEVGLRARRQHDTDDEYDELLNQATHLVAFALEKGA